MCIRIQVSLTSQLLFILSAYLPFFQRVEGGVSIEKQRPRGSWGKHTYVFLPATAPRGNSFHRGGLQAKPRTGKVRGSTGGACLLTSFEKICRLHSLSQPTPGCEPASPRLPDPPLSCSRRQRGQWEPLACAP